MQNVLNMSAPLSHTQLLLPGLGILKMLYVVDVTVEQRYVFELLPKSLRMFECCVGN